VQLVLLVEHLGNRFRPQSAEEDDR